MGMPESKHPDEDITDLERSLIHDEASPSDPDPFIPGAYLNRTRAEVQEVQRQLRGKVLAPRVGSLGIGINKTGGALSMAAPLMVRMDDYDATTGLPKMIKAGYGTSSYRDLLGLLVMEKGGDVDSVADGEPGYILQEGTAYKVDTSAWGAGDYLWLAANGLLSTTPLNGAPPVAQVHIPDAAVGILKVFANGLAALHLHHLTGMLNSILSPAQITARADDYNPSGLQTAGLLRLNSDAAYDITGITAPTILTMGRQLRIVNINAADILTLKDEDANSAAANRMALGGDIQIGHDKGVTLIYDSTSSRWRLYGEPCDGDGGLIRGIGPELTIDTGVITPTHSFHPVDTEGDAANDDIDTIAGTNALAGDTLILQSVDAARDSRAVNGADNIITRSGVNLTLNNTGQRLEFHFDGTFWTADKYTG